MTDGVPTLSTSVPLRIYRETNRDTAEVTFSSGSILADSDLNKANNQGRFLALEAVDRADESMAIDADDSTQYDIQISGADKRIFGVADPDNTNDAASKAYVDGVAMGSGVNIVTKDGEQTLTAKTLTSPKINENVTLTATATELNVMDGSATTQATVTLAGTDGVVISDADVMKQALVSDFDTYVSGTEKTLTNKTLTTPKIDDAGFIADANGAEQLVFQTTGSALNHFEMTNASSDNKPRLSAIGDSTNVGMTFDTKGNGSYDFKVGGTVALNISLSGGNTTITGP